MVDNRFDEAGQLNIKIYFEEQKKKKQVEIIFEES